MRKQLHVLATAIAATIILACSRVVQPVAEPAALNSRVQPTTANGAAQAPPTGQATEQSSKSRFTDNRNGTLTDNETGLMWEKKASQDFKPDLQNLHDVDNRYVWDGECWPRDISSPTDCQPTKTAADVCPSGVEGCQLCRGKSKCSVPDGTLTIFHWIQDLNNEDFAGHRDWRIPTLRELRTLENHQATRPAIYEDFHTPRCGNGCSNLSDPRCSCTANGGAVGGYWSSTTHPNPMRGGAAMVVEFVPGGGRDEHDKGAQIFVRAVRGRCRRGCQ
jgi:hypothetical protein